MESHCPPPPPPPAILDSEEWTFRFQVQVGSKAGRTHSPVCSAPAPGAGPVPEALTWGGGGAEAAPGGGHAGPTAPGSRKRGRGGAFSGHSAVPMITHAPQPEGLRGLWQLLQPFAVRGTGRSCFSLFQALKAGAARSSRLRHERLHNSWGRREETSLLATADQVFGIIAPVC